MKPALPAIVLAAGASSRMGQPKALLPIGPAGEPFARRIVETLVRAGLGPVVVVTREQLRGALEALRLPAEIVVNPDPGRGQLSSLLCGLDHLGEADAAMVTLVDLPLVTDATVRALVEAWQATAAPVVRPRYGFRHGHPVIFGAEALEQLRTADLEAGARPVVARLGDRSVDVPVDDPGVVEDIDTLEAYLRMRRTL